jgi:hypothetical protein
MCIFMVMATVPCGGKFRASCIASSLHNSSEEDRTVRKLKMLEACGERLYWSANMVPALCSIISVLVRDWREQFMMVAPNAAAEE